jgi:hypothetical protein
MYLIAGKRAATGSAEAAGTSSKAGALTAAQSAGPSQAALGAWEGDAAFMEPPLWGAAKDEFRSWATRVACDVIARRTGDCAAAKVRV